MHATPSRPVYAWLMLISRLLLFAVMQAIVALALKLFGVDNAWGDSARWWVFSAIGANVVSIGLLVRLFGHEGKRYRDLLRFERETIWKDLALGVGSLAPAAPIAAIPTNILANALFGSPDVPVAMMFRPLPLWAILVGLLFPLTIAFAELPTYFGYAMPRLAQQLGNGWWAWATASFFLSLQHITLPLILDWRFAVWRGLMYLPFALYIGLLIKLRPRLLPFLLIGHFLIDLLALSVYFTL